MSNKYSKTLNPVLCLVASLSPRGTHAVVVEYTLQLLGDDAYRCDYSVRNDGSLGDVAVESFNILFPVDVYLETSLAISSIDSGRERRAQRHRRSPPDRAGPKPA